MLNLDHQSATIVAFSPRSEIHGDEHVPAADIVFAFLTTNKILTSFAPALLSSLYQRDDTPGDMFAEAGALTKLKFAPIEALAWKVRASPVSLTIHFGVSGVDDISLIDCDVGKWRIEPRDGGTVAIRFTAQAHPDATDMGRLCTLIRSDVEISMIPIEQTEQLAPAPDVKQSPKDRAESMFNDPPEHADDEEDESMEVD